MSRTHSHSKRTLAASLLALALAFGAQEMLAATVTYIVGTCTSGTQFSTIQSALDASPAPNTVEVCPGVYTEQLTITKPVTVKGITGNQNGIFGGEGNGSMAQIVPPGSMNVITLLNGGSPVTASAQVYVDNVSGGAVNLTNLDVQGMYASGQGQLFIGIVYQGSSGTINQVITSMQSPSAQPGIGIWLEGGSSNPSVTVENSTIHDFSDNGLFVIGSTDGAPDLTATIKNNTIFSPQTTAFSDLDLQVGSNPTATGNFMSGALTYGIVLSGAPSGSVSGNTVFGTQYGIEVAVDGPTVTSNNIYGTKVNGIDIQTPSLQATVVESNTIRTVNPPGSSGTGIELNCNNISSSKVHSNTIVDAWEGYGDAPAGFGGSNTYLGVALDVVSCSTNGAASKRASAAARRAQ